MTKPLHFYGPLPQSLTNKGAAQVFDYSRMVGRYFEPDEKICLIIDNSIYDKLRELDEFNKSWDDDERFGSVRSKPMYGDMPRAR